MTSMPSVLARKLGRTAAPPGEDTPVEEATPTRQLRVALMRAADRTISLSLTALGVSSRSATPDQLIETGPEGWMVLGLTDPAAPGLSGLVLMDGPLRTAMIEAQTMGRVLESGDGERPVTATDAELCKPVVAGLLKELSQGDQPGFGRGLAHATLRGLPDLRAAGLMMRDVPHELWEVSVQIGATERQGQLQLILAGPGEAKDPRRPPDPDWAVGFRGAVESAPVDLTAVLGRRRMPMRQVEGLSVGQVLPLAGITVASVVLETPDGKAVARARLGQVSGLRAVRLECPAVSMSELGRPPRMDGDRGLAPPPGTEGEPSGGEVLDAQTPGGETALAAGEGGETVGEGA